MEKKKEASFLDTSMESGWLQAPKTTDHHID